MLLQRESLDIAFRYDCFHIFVLFFRPLYIHIKASWKHQSMPSSIHIYPNYKSASPPASARFPHLHSPLFILYRKSVTPILHSSLFILHRFWLCRYTLLREINVIFWLFATYNTIDSYQKIRQKRSEIWDFLCLKRSLLLPLQMLMAIISASVMPERWVCVEVAELKMGTGKCVFYTLDK